MYNNSPIGVFDSGLGGISVLNHLTTLLPHENFLYVADSAFCPYGIQSHSYIQNRALSIVDFFLTNQVKLVVVACNTATAAAIATLRNTYSIPFVGMEPAIKPAAALTKTNVVGVLATQNTFNGDLFRETKQRYAKHIDTIIQVGHGLVEIVEKNQINSYEAHRLISKYIEPMVAATADYLVLGCTHYPFLKNVIQSVAPHLIIIDPAEPVARRTMQLLEMHNLASNSFKTPHIELFTTGDEEQLLTFARNYIKGHWKAKRVHI